jgi:hypothetical protein
MKRTTDFEKVDGRTGASGNSKKLGAKRTLIALANQQRDEESNTHYEKKGRVDRRSRERRRRMIVLTRRTPRAALGKPERSEAFLGCEEMNRLLLLDIIASALTSNESTGT